MPTPGREVQAEWLGPSQPARVNSHALLGRAPRTFDGKLLPEVAEGQDLDVTLTDFVDDSIGLVEDLSHRSLMPLWNDPALVRHVTGQVDSLK